MRYEIRLLEVSGGERQLAGAALGERLFRERIAPSLAALRANTVLLLSFRGVESVTGSVLKATWHRLHPEEGVLAPSMLVHLSEDVREEFAIYLRSERLAGLEACDWTNDSVVLARLHGHLEESAKSALRALVVNPGVTAPQLRSIAGETVSPTAWTNRLNELHRQGLAIREKAGRAWRFFPLVERIHIGSEVGHG